MSDTITPTVISADEITFSDEAPRRVGGGRTDSLAGVVELLPLLKKNPGKWAPVVRGATNSATTTLNKRHGADGFKFTFRADDGTDGKRGTVSGSYVGPVEVPAEPETTEAPKAGKK